MMKANSHNIIAFGYLPTRERDKNLASRTTVGQPDIKVPLESILLSELSELSELSDKRLFIAEIAEFYAEVTVESHSKC